MNSRLEFRPLRSCDFQKFSWILDIRDSLLVYRRVSFAPVFLAYEFSVYQTPRRRCPAQDHRGDVARQDLGRAKMNSETTNSVPTR